MNDPNNVLMDKSLRYCRSSIPALIQILKNFKIDLLKPTSRHNFSSGRSLSETYLTRLRRKSWKTYLARLDPWVSCFSLKTKKTKFLILLFLASFKLVYDRETGKPKGYGFCEYKVIINLVCFAHRKPFVGSRDGSFRNEKSWRLWNCWSETARRQRLHRKVEDGDAELAPSQF